MNNTHTKQKIKTFLPVFQGFYNSIWEFDDQNIIEYINEERQENNKIGQIDFDNIEVEYQRYEIDLAINIVSGVKNLLDDYIINIEYERTYSPKEYNFKNDSINVIIEANIDNIQKYIHSNIDQYKLYLKAKYTSCDGFISAYSNNFDSWMDDTDNFTNFDNNGHYLGSVLEFIAENEGITEINIYYDLEGFDQYEYLTNYEECLQAPLCSGCNKFIKNDNIINDLGKYQKITGNNPSKILCDDCLE